MSPTEPISGSAAADLAVAAKRGESRPRLPIFVAGISRRATSLIGEALLDVDPHLSIIQADSGGAVRDAFKSPAIEIAIVDHTLADLGKDLFASWALERAHGRTLVLLAEEVLLADAPSEFMELASRLRAYDAHARFPTPSQLAGLVTAHRRMRQSCRTLLVDQSSTLRRLVRTLLERSRFTFDIDDTESGPSALAMAAASPYHLALISASVRRDDGLELALKLAGAYPAMKIVFMGQSDLWNSKRVASQFGFSAYLKRPFGPAQLEATLHDVHELAHPYFLKSVAEGAEAPQPLAMTN
jgi:CheY-like chemotaxis protein